MLRPTLTGAFVSGRRDGWLILWLSTTQEQMDIVIRTEQDKIQMIAGYGGMYMCMEWRSCRLMGSLPALGMFGECTLVIGDGTCKGIVDMFQGHRHPHWYAYLKRS